MSEVAPSICPKFCRKLPEETANDKINEIFGAVLQDAVLSLKSKNHLGDEQYSGAVADVFHRQLGEGSIETTIEVIAKELPDQFVAHVEKSETPFMYVDRIDNRSFAHPAVLSPLITLAAHNSENPCHVGTDKLGHFVQQGYDYFLIYKTIEAREKGLGELFASAWGHWSEGEQLSDGEIGSYLKSRNLSSDEARVRQLKREIFTFLTESEMVERLSPTPAWVKKITPLRKLAHLIGAHQFGILGSAMSGVISHADLAANEAGLVFYRDLSKDPEYVAKNFDIADYASCDWDEEVLKSKFSPVVEERIQEALRGKKESYLVRGIGAAHDFINGRISFSTPVFYYAGDNYEVRARVGAPFGVFASVDLARRISGLHFAYVSTTVTATPAGIYSLFEAGYEVMLLGSTSFKIGRTLDFKDGVSSIVVGVLNFRR